MTEEEIKQKAEEWMRNNSERCTKENMNGYDFAIATCIAVTTEATKELETQIEKMKCCGNCAKNGHICVAEEMQGKLCGKNKVKWELRR